MCDHLNTSGRERQTPCRPEYRARTGSQRLFSSSLRDGGTLGLRYRRYGNDTSEQLIPFRNEAARLRQSLRDSPGVSSPLVAAASLEPDGSLRPAPEVNLSREVCTVEPDDPVSLESSFLLGHTSPRQGLFERALLHKVCIIKRRSCNIKNENVQH